MVSHCVKVGHLIPYLMTGRELGTCDAGSWPAKGILQPSRPGDSFRMGKGRRFKDEILRFLRFALKSGGCIKFDLKTGSEALSLALCGVSNRQGKENFAWLAGYVSARPDPPLLIASTLMVPGYVDEEEVREIAEFIASLNPDIPYSLLAFHPQFLMKDLPVTSKSQARACLKAAREAGLKNVNVGNIHLIQDDL